MALYFKDIEITNIDNLVPQSGLDVTDIWFCSTNVYTVWEVYEGTLPATINANGDDMRQYQVYGNTGGVGDRTVNLLDKQNMECNKYVQQSGNKGGDINWDIYYVTATNGEQYTATGVSTINSGAYIGYADANKNILGIVGTALDITPQTVTMPDTGTFLAVSARKSATTPMLTEGSTAPETYVPYGYEVDMGVKSGNLLSFDALINAPSGNINNHTFPHILGLALKPYTKYTAVSDGDGREDGTPENNRSVYIKETSTQNCVFRGHPVTVQTGADGVIKIGIQSERQNAQQYINGTAHVWLVEGDAPLPYQPYSNTTTPIYIGSDPLEKDEYIDCQARKVFRRTVNLLNWKTAKEGYQISPSTGLPMKWNTPDSQRIATMSPIDVSGAETVVVSYDFAGTDEGTLWFMYSLLDTNNTLIELTASKQSGENISIPPNAVKMYLAWYKTSTMLTTDSITSAIVTKTLSETYIPYLQPTDPPVALPALPTCEGTTIVDYAGQSVATPEKVVLEYRKEGY